MPFNSEAKKWFNVLAGVTDPGYQGEIGLPLHDRGKEEYVWSTGDPLGHHLVQSSCDLSQCKTTT